MKPLLSSKNVISIAAHLLSFLILLFGAATANAQIDFCRNLIGLRNEIKYNFTSVSDYIPSDSTDDRIIRLLGGPLVKKVGEGNFKVAFQNPNTRDGRVVKLYKYKSDYGDWSENVPFIIERDLALQDVLKGIGLPIVPLETDYELIKFGVLMQRRIEGISLESAKKVLDKSAYQAALAKYEKYQKIIDTYGRKITDPLRNRYGDFEPPYRPQFQVDTNHRNFIIDRNGALHMIDW